MNVLRHPEVELKRNNESITGTCVKTTAMFSVNSETFTLHQVTDPIDDDDDDDDEGHKMVEDGKESCDSWICSPPPPRLFRDGVSIDPLI